MDGRTFFETAPAEILWLIFAYAINPIPINRRMLKTRHYYNLFVDIESVTDIFAVSYCKRDWHELSWLLDNPNILHVSTPMVNETIERGMEGYNILIVLKACIDLGKSSKFVNRVLERSDKDCLAKITEDILIPYTWHKKQKELGDLLVRNRYTKVKRIHVGISCWLYPQVRMRDCANRCLISLNGYFNITPEFFKLVDGK
jgi:hypothetical protein